MRTRAVVVMAWLIVSLALSGCAPPSAPIRSPGTTGLSPTAPATAGTAATRLPPSPTVALATATRAPTTGAGGNTPFSSLKLFDGTHAMQSYMAEQIKIGIRPPGSAADRATGDYIIAQLKDSHWTAVTQEFVYRKVPVRNVLGKAGEGKGPLIIIGAHYDTRIRADQDKTHPEQPVMGANDGASGVAVLLELARTLDITKLRNEVWLAFFDAEDQGELPGCVVVTACDSNDPWPWSVGATYVAEQLSTKPAAVIIVDMIGDADQNIYYEYNSDKELQEQIWGVAARLGYGAQFIQEYKWSMDDDHTPFIQRGIRAVDMIDFDYPYWHTTQDTIDKVSAASLERVGRTLEEWLENQK